MEKPNSAPHHTSRNAFRLLTSFAGTLTAFASCPRPVPRVGTYSLDSEILRFSPRDPWTLRDACEGVMIFGGIGSGKSSASGRTFAKAMLQQGYGFLVLTAKTDETEHWKQLCKETGREDSLILFGPDHPYRFNPLAYEACRPGPGGGLTHNLVALFSTLFEVADRNSGQANNDEFWQRTLEQLLRNAIDLLLIAKGSVSLPDIARVIRSAPRSERERESTEWQNGSLCCECIREGDHKKRAGELTTVQQNDFQQAAEYFWGDYPRIPEKTRGCIEVTFSSLADAFLRGMLRELFCTSTNLVPEMILESGAVVVLDMPVKEYGEAGRLAQVLFKHTFQRSAERRNPGGNPRPAVLWMDEGQQFLTSQDKEVQATARSARLITVCISQNLPGFYSVLPGDQGRAEVDAFLGNLQTKIFHQNACSITNEFAADQIGKILVYRGTSNMSTALNDSGEEQLTQAAGGRESLDWEVIPRVFSTLKKGGPTNNFEAEAIVFQGGRTFDANGRNALRVLFSQRA